MRRPTALEYRRRYELHCREGKATPEENSASIRGIDAAVDCCYGGGVVAKPEELTARQPVDPMSSPRTSSARSWGCSVWRTPAPRRRTPRTEAALEEVGKTYEFHTYDNGHAFFAVDRPQYRQSAEDGWKKVLAWFELHLH